jgi:hypothetical protein
MNVLDFTVTKIIEENRGKGWQIYGLSEEEAKERAKGDEFLQELYFSEVVKQVYEYDCYGVLSITDRVAIVGKDELYYVGYKGIC